MLTHTHAKAHRMNSRNSCSDTVACCFSPRLTRMTNASSWAVDAAILSSLTSCTRQQSTRAQNTASSKHALKTVTHGLQVLHVDDAMPIRIHALEEVYGVAVVIVRED